MKQVIICTILSLSAFGLFVGGGLLVQGKGKSKVQNEHICPDCGETGCIYKEINGRAGEGSDSDYLKAIYEVCKERNITDPKIIDIIKANYYL